MTVHDIPRWIAAMDARTPFLLCCSSLETMKTPIPRFVHLALASGAIFTPCHWLAAADFDGGASTTKYQDALNWSTDAVPTGADAVAIGNAGTWAVEYDSATSLATTGQLLLGNGGIGSLTLSNTAGTLGFGGDGFSTAARIGASGGSGSLVVGAGTVKIGNAVNTDASINLAAWNGGTTPVSGSITVNGSGTLEVGRRILMGANQGAGRTQNAILTLAGNGVINMVRSGSNGEGDLGMIRLGNGTNTLNFDGGTFIGTGLHLSGAAATSSLYYNGTEFRANASGTMIGSGGSSVNQIKAGGLIVNTNGFDTVIARGLANFTDVSGVLTKNGTGKLTLSSAGHSYSSTVVNAGSLDFTANDAFGSHSSSTHSLTVNQGALVTNSTGAAGFVTFQNLTLNGGELRATNTLSAVGTGRFQAYGIKGTVTVGGSTASVISDVGQANGHINIGGLTAGTQTTFQVGDVTGSAATDLLVSAKLQNNATAGSLVEVSTGIVKSGAGKMELTGVSRYTGETTVSAGTLALSGAGSIANSSVINVQAGAFLDVSSVTTPWELATNQSLVGNGTITGVATVGGTIAPGSSIGALNFSDTLALTGIATMELDAAAGTSDLIAVASAMVFGGTLNVSNLNGGFSLGQSFDLFDFASATGAFGEINLPSLDGGLSWDQSQIYTTGKLSVVPEPTVLVLAPLSLGLLVRRRRPLQ